MSSLKMMSSSTSRNSNLSRRNSSSASSSPSIRSHQLRHTEHSTTNFLSDPNPSSFDDSNGDRNSVIGRRNSVEDVWKEIISGEKGNKVKDEPHEEEYIMTLEDFLLKAEAAMEDYSDVKIQPSLYPMIQQEEEKKKRGRVMMDVMDKAEVQRQKRMIKNRESAARSRERKQLYQKELETLAAKLEEENEMLLKEIKVKTKERYNKLMEQLIPVVDKPKPVPSLLRSLSRSHSLEW